jgi:hypothetical protein
MKAFVEIVTIASNCADTIISVRRGRRKKWRIYKKNKRKMRTIGEG